MERKSGILNKTTIILAALLVAAIAFIIVLIFPKERKINALERIGINDFSDKVIISMEEIDRTVDSSTNVTALPKELKDISKDRFIAYALEYAYEKDNKTTLTANEIKDIIENIFDIEISTDEINSVGISPTLLDKNVGHDPVNEAYTISKENRTKREIALIPIAKYIQTSVKAEDDNYVVKYDKYIVKNPYDVLSITNNDMSKINDYLNGKGKASSIKAIINADNAASVASKEKETTIKYTVKNDKITIVSIE